MSRLTATATSGRASRVAPQIDRAATTPETGRPARQPTAVRHPLGVDLSSVSILPPSLSNRREGAAADYCSVPVHSLGLTRNQPTDAAERAASQAADLAMRPGARGVAADSSRPAPRIAGVPTLPAVSGQGMPIERSLGSAMAERFGFDFSQVRVHTDALAATATEALQARAYTVGNHIHFARGQYAPGTIAGQHLLAHELAHVLQQAHSGVASIQCEADPAPTISKDWSTDEMLARLAEAEELVAISPPNPAAAAAIVDEVRQWLLLRTAASNISRQFAGRPFARAQVDVIISQAVDSASILKTVLRTYSGLPLLSKFRFERQRIAAARELLLVLNNERAVSDSAVANVDRGANVTAGIAVGPAAAALAIALAPELAIYGRNVLVNVVRNFPRDVSGMMQAMRTLPRFGFAQNWWEGALVSGALGAGASIAKQHDSSKDFVDGFDSVIWWKVGLEFVVAAAFGAWIGRVMAMIKLPTSLSLGTLFSAENLAILIRQQGLLALPSWGANVIRSLMVGRNVADASITTLYDSLLSIPLNGFVQLAILGPWGEAFFKRAAPGLTEAERLTSRPAAYLRAVIALLRQLLVREIRGINPTPNASKQSSPLPAGQPAAT